MSNVTLTIGGRAYTVACAPGEEQHVQDLGRMIDGKLAEMGGAQHSETRALLFAALLLADALHERGDSSVTAAAVPAPAAGPDAGKLEAIADRLENIAALLEDGDQSA
jgi:cell division protein ZapA